jgi:hypothetical protein
MMKLDRLQVEKVRSLLAYMLTDLKYTDDFFQLLFVDVDNNATDLAQGLFGDEDRRVMLYGPRGVGKSAILQGISFSGIQHGMQRLPIVAKITEARSVGTVADLEDRFFTAVAKGIASIPEIHSRWSKGSKTALGAKYSPWIAAAVGAAAGLFVQPLALASGVIAETIRSVVKPSNYRSLEELLTSSSTRPPRLAELLVTKLDDRGIEPVFIIDELDKITDSDVVHNFIEGNQSWFEGRNVVLTMSYNIGESLKKISTASVRRIASPKPYLGLTNIKQGEQIIYDRAVVGYAMRYRSLAVTTKSARQEVHKILPQSAIAEIIERTFPNPSRMLQLTYDILDEAASKRRPIEEALGAAVSAKTSKVRVTKQRLKTLKALSNGSMTLAELARLLGADSRELFISLGLMVDRGLLQTIGEGKGVHYHLTEEGNTMLQLNKRRSSL